MRFSKTARFAMLGFALWIGWAERAARAQMPHELLLLVNENSLNSLSVANHYVALRRLPRENVVFLDVPADADVISPAEFAKRIWEPANRAMRERGIEDHILAWVYSADFPAQVATDPDPKRRISLCGMTFVRNVPPSPEAVASGSWRSPLFGGTTSSLPLFLLPPRSLIVCKEGAKGLLPLAEDAPPVLVHGLRDRMPLPAMILGKRGSDASIPSEVLDALERAKNSDHHGVNEGFLFAESGEAPPVSREVSFSPAAAELQRLGVRSRQLAALEPVEGPLMGISASARRVDVSCVGFFAPGAMAIGGAPAREWMKAGATVAVGVMSGADPSAEKLPDAGAFVGYVSGCTALESIYESVSSPLQLEPMGDPLAAPYAMKIGVRLLGADRISTSFTYLSDVEGLPSSLKPKYLFLVDGRIIQPESGSGSFYLPVLDLEDGCHELRVAMRIANFIRVGGEASKNVVVRRGSRGIRLVPRSEVLAQHEHGFAVAIDGEPPERVRLLSGLRILDEKVYSTDVELVLDDLLLGEGPNTLRPAAVYADGSVVEGPPLPICLEKKE